MAFFFSFPKCVGCLENFHSGLWFASSPSTFTVASWLLSSQSFYFFLALRGSPQCNRKRNAKLSWEICCGCHRQAWLVAWVSEHGCVSVGVWAWVCQHGRVSLGDCSFLFLKYWLQILKYYFVEANVDYSRVLILRVEHGFDYWITIIDLDSKSESIESTWTLTLFNLHFSLLVLLEKG